MLSNDERALLHTAVLIDRGGDLTDVHVNEDGFITAYRMTGTLTDVDQDGSITAQYLAATFVKIDGLEIAQAIEELTQIGIGRRAAKAAVSGAIDDTHFFSKVLKRVEPLYSDAPETTTAIAGDT
ncbi:MAG: hypothetical protein AAF742_00040 [Pseudomonadota bacterium]